MRLRGKGREAIKTAFNPIVTVDERQCRRIAHRLKPIREKELFPPPVTKGEKVRRANFWFFLVAICHKTASLQGTIEGYWLRGWDYLRAAGERQYRKDPFFFTPERVRLLREEDLKAVFSDDLNPLHSSLDRVQERLFLLLDCAEGLLQWYHGDVWNLYMESGGYIRGDNGLLSLLSRFQAYKDPLGKKSYLFFMVLWASKIWEFSDLDNLRFPVDNHLMRVCLRSGMVRVQEGIGDGVEGVEGEKVACPLLREAVMKAGEELVRASGRTVFELDTILWHIGRNCCFYAHEPVCGERAKGKACFKKARCTLLRDTNYPCDNICLLNGVCLGSLYPEYAAYQEPEINTHFY